MEASATNSVIHLELCNNITSCDINIQHGALNIKYAVNGTGKSTVAKAIVLASQGKPLTSLKPFVLPQGTPSSASPTVTGVPFSNVALFDAEYVRQYVFQPTDLIKDSFEIFIRTPNYDESKARIEADYNSIMQLFSESDALRVLSTGLHELRDTLATNTDGSFSRRTKGIKGILDQQKCSLETPPEELKVFQPFFDDKSLAVDWAAWKLTGTDKYANRGICPFCAVTESKEIIQQNRLFSESFDKDSITLTSKLLACVDKLSQFIDPSKLVNIRLLLSPDGNRTSLDVEMKKLLAEADYILERVEALASFNGLSIKKDQISQLVTYLSNKKIDTGSFDYFNTAKLQEDISILNRKIDEVLQAIGNLQQSIGSLHACLINQLSKKTKDINEFLLSAGFKYTFDIKVDNDGVAHALLLFNGGINNLVPVNDPATHLSWGEKNAFSLLLFMFDAIRKNSDLVILDDPISSFDSSKKYAIINRLFMTGNRENSLYMRTVLLLTHDMEPVIDYVQVGGKIDSSFLNATFMQNLDGTLVEYPIQKDIDIISTIIVMKKVACEENVALPARVGCLRKYIEHTTPSPFIESMAYNVLSSLIHGRDYPTYDAQGDLPMSPQDFQAGLLEIIEYIPSFDYNTALEHFESKSLLEQYHRATNRFVQLLILRAYIQRYSEAKVRLKARNDVLRKYIDETFHIENDYIYSFNFLNFAIVPDFISLAASDFAKSEYPLYGITSLS